VVISIGRWWWYVAQCRSAKVVFAEQDNYGCRVCMQHATTDIRRTTTTTTSTALLRLPSVDFVHFFFFLLVGRVHTQSRFMACLVACDVHST